MSHTKSSLDSFVSSFVRETIAGKTTHDEDLDKYVADLLAREAKQRQEQYQRVGMTVYSQERPKISANKRFLKNVIQSVDDHNRSILRQETKGMRSDTIRRDSVKKSEKLRPNSPRRRSRSRSRRRRSKSRSRSRSRRKRRSRNDHSRERYKKKRDKRPKSRSRSRSKKESTPPSAFANISKTSNMNQTEIKTPNPIQTEIKKPAVKRGRGESMANGSRLDKYFQPDYNPRLDMANYDASTLHHYVEAVIEHQKRKK